MPMTTHDDDELIAQEYRHRDRMLRRTCGLAVGLFFFAIFVAILKSNGAFAFVDAVAFHDGMAFAIFGLAFISFPLFMIGARKYFRCPRCGNPPSTPRDPTTVTAAKSRPGVAFGVVKCASCGARLA